MFYFAKGSKPQAAMNEREKSPRQPGKRLPDAAHFVISPILEIANCQGL
jgi:hypothetical protein